MITKSLARWESSSGFRLYMGGRCSRRAPSPTHPQLSDFLIIRSIGRGAFGKVASFISISILCFSNSNITFCKFLQTLQKYVLKKFGDVDVVLWSLQVCIAQYRRTKKHYALKYMNKRRCVQHMVADSVLRELDLLAHLSHPFIVNLWFAFQVFEVNLPNFAPSRVFTSQNILNGKPCTQKVVP